MTGSEPLKPCPFCGTTAEVKHVEHGQLGHEYDEIGCPVCCDVCHLRMNWNRRAPSPVVAEVVKRLRAAAIKCEMEMEPKRNEDFATIDDFMGEVLRCAESLERGE